MGEEAVEEEQPGGAARDRAADAGQVVELAEGPGKGGLASLVGAGHDEDALATLQAELVGDYRLALRDELLARARSKVPAARTSFERGGDLGIAEAQPSDAKRPDVVEVCEIELELLVGAPDALVEEPGVPAAVLVQGGELLREEPGHQLEDLSGDVVHPRPRPVAGPGSPSPRPA